jgi:hypothetical protein
MRWAIALTCGLLIVALPAPAPAAEANEAAALQAAEEWLKRIEGAVRCVVGRGLELVPQGGVPLGVGDEGRGSA